MKSVDSSAAVQVSFNLPAEAALLLSQLAHLGSPGLAQIGVTSVSIDDAEAILLQINNGRGSDATERNKTVDNVDERHTNCSAQPSSRILSSLRNNIMQLLGIATNKIETAPVLCHESSPPQKLINVLYTETTETTSNPNIQISDIKPVSTLPVFVEEQELEIDEKRYNRPWQSAESKETEKKVSDLKELDVKIVRFSQDDETDFPHQQPPLKGFSLSPSVSSLPQRSLSVDPHTSSTIVARSSPDSALEINSEVIYSKEIVLRSDEHRHDKLRSLIETITVPPPSYLTTDEPDELNLIRRRSVDQDMMEDRPRSSDPTRLIYRSSSPKRIDDMRGCQDVTNFEHSIRSDGLSASAMSRDRMPNVEPASRPSISPNYSPVTRDTIPNIQPVSHLSIPGSYSLIARDQISNMEPVCQQPMPGHYSAIAREAISNIVPISQITMPGNYSPVVVSRDKIHPVSRQPLPGNYSPITMSMDEILKASPRSHHLKRHNDSTPLYSLPRDHIHKAPPTSPKSIRPVDLTPMTRPVDEMWMKVPPESRHIYGSRGVSPRSVSPSSVSIMKVARNDAWKIPPISQQSSRPVSWSPPNMLAVDDVPHSLSRQPIVQAERQRIRHHDQDERFEIPHSSLSLHQSEAQGERQSIRHRDQNEMFEVPHIPLSHRQPIRQAERQSIGHRNQNEMLDIPRSPLSPHVPKKKRRKLDIPLEPNTNAQYGDAHLAAAGSSDHDSFLPVRKRYSPAESAPFHPLSFSEQRNDSVKETGLFARGSGLTVDNHRDKRNISDKSRATPDDITRTTPNENLALMNYDHGKREFGSDERDQFRESLSYSSSSVREADLPRREHKYGGSNRGSVSRSFTPPGSPSKSQSLDASKARNIKEFKEMSLLNSTGFEPNNSSTIAERERMDIPRNFELSEKCQKMNLVASDAFDSVSSSFSKNAPAPCGPLGGIFNGMFDDLRRLENQSTSINSFNSIGFPLARPEAKSYIPHDNFDLTKNLNTSAGFYDMPRSLYEFPRPGISPFELPRLGEPALFDLRMPSYPERTRDITRPFDPTPYDLKNFIDPVPSSYNTKKSADPPTPYEFSLGNWVSSNHSPSLSGSGAQSGSQIYQPWQEFVSSQIHVKLKQIDREQPRSATDDLDERNTRPPSLDDRYTKVAATRDSSDCGQGSGVVPKKRIRLCRAPSNDEQNLDDSFIDERIPKDHLRNNETFEKTGDKSVGDVDRLGQIYANPPLAGRDFPISGSSADSSKMHLKKIRLVRWNNSSADHTADDRISAPTTDHFNSVRPVLWNRSDKKRDKMASDDWQDDTRIIQSTLTAESSDALVNARDIEQGDNKYFVQSNAKRYNDDYTASRKSNDVSKASFSHQPEGIKLMLKEDLENDCSGGGMVSKKHRAIRYFLARRSSSVGEAPPEAGGSTEDKSVITSPSAPGENASSSAPGENISSSAPGENEGVLKINDIDGPSAEAVQEGPLPSSSITEGGTGGDSLLDTAASNVEGLSQLSALDGPGKKTSAQNEDHMSSSLAESSNQQVVETVPLSSLYVHEESPPLSSLYVPEEAPPLSSSYVHKESPPLSSLYVPEEAPPLSSSYVSEVAPYVSSLHVPEEAPPLSSSFMPEEAPSLSSSFVPEEAPPLSSSCVPEEQTGRESSHHSSAQ